MDTSQRAIQGDVHQQYQGPPTGNEKIPSTQVIVQQQPGARIDGVGVSNSIHLVKPEAFLQYQTSSRIPGKNANTRPDLHQTGPQQHNTISDTQAGTLPAKAQEWPLNLISAAFQSFGYTIALDNEQWTETGARLFDNLLLDANRPALDPALSWHRLAAPPLVSRYATNELTDEQQAAAVVAKIIGAGLLTRLPLDKAFVIAAFEFLLSLTEPVSNASTHPLLVKCHHCASPMLTRVEHVRGAATWGCMYLMCFFWLPCLSVMFWSNESWMNKRHYCSVCGRLLALWEKMRSNREKGTKVYTQWGSFRLQPGQELASFVHEV